MRYTQRAALIAALILPAAPVAAGSLRLVLPLDCVLGDTCYIQHLVDRDPGPGVQDYRCGTLSYDGHKGTDFALPTLANMHEGVNVLAAAAGIVTGQRDGIADIGLTKDIDGRECGNGVVLRHDGGWETQYCHMKRGSVQVQTGDRVSPGDVLGQVGLSGETDFPHLHLSVRRDGAVVDPFAPISSAQCDNANIPNDLWENTPTYSPGGLQDAGFSVGIPDYDTVKDGSAAQPNLAAKASGLVIYGLGFAGQKGDVIRMQITGPNGQILSHSATLDKDQSQFFRAAGKRRTTPRWLTGAYTGIVTMQRGKAILGQKIRTITIY